MDEVQLILAPGASGGVESLKDHVAGLTERGLSTRVIDLPRGRAERAVPVYRAAVADARARELLIGGHSFGGRVASLIAAEQSVLGLVLLSYPLHAPGRGETWRQRTDHWPRIGCPVLVLSGEADPFARIELLQMAVKKLPQAELVTYPRVGHGLRPVLEDALDRITTFVTRLTA